MIFYHVTKMGREEDILCEGLRPDLMEARSYPKPHGRKAVFLWGSLRSARIAERSEAFNGTLDGKIFRVRLPRGWVVRDPTILADTDEPEDHFVCFRRIPPECLEILHYGRWRRREFLERRP